MATLPGKKQPMIQMSLLALVSFLLGAVNNISFDFVGQVYLVELALVVVVVFLLATGKSSGAFRARIFWGFMFAIMLTLVGYMISDLSVGTESSQYLRGWGRVVLLLTDCATLMILTAHNRQNLWWFMLGTGVGGIIYLAANGVTINTWKLGYGEPISMLVLTLAPLFLPKRLALLALAGFGALNIVLDYRILGAVFITVAAIIWARPKHADLSAISFAKYAKLTIILAFSLMGIAVSTLLTQDEYAARRDASNVGRFAAITVAMRAIAESPIIGYGSWTINQKYADMVRREIEAKRDRSLARVQPLGWGSGFSTHSQILQSWIEGGLLGAAFFFVYGYQLVRAIHWYGLRRPVDIFSAAFTFTLIISLWSWMASPFNGSGRIQIAMAVAVIAATTYDRHRKLRDSAPRKPELRAAGFMRVR